MKTLFFILLFIPFFASAQNTYLLSSSGSNFQIGNTIYPYNSAALIISRDTNAIGFVYVLIPPSTFQFEHTILSPTNFANFYTVSGSDTTIFTSAYGVQQWYNSNAVSATGNLDMEIGEEVIGSTINLPLYVDGSGNLAQYTSKPLLNSDTTSLVATKNNLTLKANITSVPVIATGAYSITGVSLQTAYVFAHGLGYIPSHVSIEPTSLGASGAHYTSWDGTNITVTFAAAPGVVPIALHWLSIK